MVRDETIAGGTHLSVHGGVRRLVGGVWLARLKVPLLLLPSPPANKLPVGQAHTGLPLSPQLGVELTILGDYSMEMDPFMTNTPETSLPSGVMD